MLGIPFSLFGFGALYALARSLSVGPEMDLQQWIVGCMVVGTFGTIGFLLLLGVGAIVRGAMHENRLKSMFPGQPWLHRKDWAEGKSDHSATGLAVVYLGIAVLVNSLTIGFLFVVLLDERMNLWGGMNPLAVCSLGFVFLTMTGGVYALRIVTNAIRFRPVSCELVATPFQPGDAVRCLVHWNGCQPPPTLTVALECKATRHGLNKPRYSEDNNIYEHDLYQMRYVVELPEIVSIENVPPLAIRFPLPESVPETDTNGARWQLRLIWLQRGMEQDLRFDVPIFHSAEAVEGEIAEQFDSREASRSDSGYPDNARAETLGQLVESSFGLFEERADRQWELELPLYKTPSVGRVLGKIMSVGALLAFGGGAIACGGVVGAAFFGLFILAIFRMGGKQRLACDGSTVEYQRQGFLRTRIDSFACDEPLKISTGQVEKHSERLGYHQVTAVLELEGEVVILRNAVTALLAKRICKKLQASCGLISSD